MHEVLPHYLRAPEPESTELAAHRAVFDAAKGLSRLMDEVEQDQAGQNDRVFAHFEFDQLRYAIGLVENLKRAATIQIEPEQPRKDAP